MTRDQLRQGIQHHAEVLADVLRLVIPVWCRLDVQVYLEDTSPGTIGVKYKVEYDGSQLSDECPCGIVAATCEYHGPR